MKIISEQECQQWLRTTFGQDFAWKVLEANYVHCVTFQIPIDSGKKTALARALSACIAIGSPGLLWITGWEVFPSAQNMALFNGYRESLRETRDIKSAPGHIFDGPDSQKLECLLLLVLYFYWDAGLFDEAGSIAVRISHDEYLSVYGKSAESLQRFEQALRRLSLKELTRPV